MPSVYVLEGMPYNLVNVLALAYFTLKGIGIDEVAFWISLLGLPWVVKPLWSPLLERLRRPERAIWALQGVMGCLFLLMGSLSGSPHWYIASLLALGAVSLTSATHDCVADGFYIRALKEGDQSFFSGIRNTFYRAGLLIGGGLILVLYGELKDFPLCAQNETCAWQFTFGAVALCFLAGAFYHWKALPVLGEKAHDCTAKGEEASYWEIWGAFFRKPKILRMLAFILLYRFAEALLVKTAPVFMLTSRAEGGLGLTAAQYGAIYGTLGVIALLCGGIIGGWIISRSGLKNWFWPMAIALNLPDIFYVYLALAQPENIYLTGACVAIEQFGYGFGFTAFMVYLLYVARGNYPTAHYALCTAFMALGMLLPGLISGELALHWGFPVFFSVVCGATVFSFLAVKIAPLDENFGKRA